MMIKINRLVPYGSAEQGSCVAKVSKGKTPHSLVARMPSAEIAAKVGPVPAPASPISPDMKGRLRRVERLNSRN